MLDPTWNIPTYRSSLPDGFNSSFRLRRELRTPPMSNSHLGKLPSVGVTAELDHRSHGLSSVAVFAVMIESAA
jgi:hypothetical protein